MGACNPGRIAGVAKLVALLSEDADAHGDVVCLGEGIVDLLGGEGVVVVLCLEGEWVTGAFRLGTGWMRSDGGADGVIDRFWRVFPTGFSLPRVSFPPLASVTPSPVSWFGGSL